jgi:glycogen(starch) synthase
MRILHLSWEYPPVLYGGLGRHVHALASAQAAEGHDVLVITQAPTGSEGATPYEDQGAVRVLRASTDPGDQDGGDLLGQMACMEWAFVDAGESLLADWSPEVIHAHDWMVSHAAVSLRSTTGAPLVATIHATEAGRNGGTVTSDLSTRIHELEWWLANTADVVIACSRAMRSEVRTLFGRDTARVIPNGIALAEWQRPNGEVERMRRTHAPSGPLIAYTGRVEYEKGVQVLLDAMPRVRAERPDARLVVAGRGSYLPALQAQATDLGIDGSTDFLGWVSEQDLRALVAAADVAVAPSLYEPFGLVALEAAALGTPVIVSQTGGLAELADDSGIAATARPGDAADLADAIIGDLAAPRASRARAERATRVLGQRYGWARIARGTVQAYRGAAEALSVPASDPRHAQAVARHSLGPPSLVAPLGRLLDLEP